METIILTESDQLILRSYCSFCDSLSHFLGSAYEIVLHSLENYEHSAIRVINGFHTGRSEGAPITDLALKMLKKIRSLDSHQEYLCYFSTNQYGSPLKSTTIPIYGEHDRIIGLLCINFYLDTPYREILNSMIPDKQRLLINVQNEFHVNSAEELLRETVRRVSQEVHENHNILTANRNKEIITRLQADGIFNLKNAVACCASELGISKNTVYMHLRNLS